MILIGFRLPIPAICDRHINCEQADEWAARFGKAVDHPNQRLGRTRPYGKPACSVPGCTRLVWEWGLGHEGHVDEDGSSKS